MNSGPAQGLADFPGITQLVSASMVFHHGISPCTCLLTIAPQQDFAGQGGTLSFFYDGVEIDFPNCKVDRHSFERNASGLVWRLTIFDRRWKWAWGGISGFYNQRNDDGTIKAATEMAPQDLASLLLDEMGEEGYDVGDLPNDTRPAVEWDYDVPAQALARLCDDLGCRVVLQLDDTVALRVVGEGEDLPQDLILDNSLTIDPPEQPDTLSIACGYDRYQADWVLQAVGAEQDGSLVAIDTLSYRPSAGWAAASADMPALKFLAVDQQHRQRARSSVWRYYRIVVPQTLPDVDDPVAKLDQVLPIEDQQVETVSTTDSSGQTVVTNKKAAVYGSFFLNDSNKGGLKNTIALADINPNAFENTPVEYKRPFRIDRDRGLVIFQEPVYANSNDTSSTSTPSSLTIGQPTLRLRVACPYRDSDTFAPTRYTRDRDESDEFDTPTRYIRHDEIVLTHVPVYDTEYDIQSVTTNRADVNKECDYYLDAAEQQYETTYPQTLKYVGLRDDIELDGAIHQIVFDVSRQGTTTTVSRNDEQVHKFVSYKERRMLESASRLRQLADRLQPAALRQLQRTIKGS
jgi:hypothetical protein